MTIPFLSFEFMHNQIKNDMLKTFEEVFESNWYILGKKLDQFENEYSKFNKVKYTIGVSNGLDALQLALKISGIKEGDEVIVPSNTYIATWLAVSFLGATPVPVEPNIDTYNIDFKLIESAITHKTKAIIPVHLFGQACQMDEIMAIANKYDLKVIEDNAQAHGSSYKGKLTGSFGHINATSFYPGKNLGALGDAGAITTDIESYSRRAKLLRNYGSEKKYFNEEIGYNMRLDELQAAFLSLKLEHLNIWTKQRQNIAKLYNLYLAELTDIILPKTINNSNHVYHQFVIRNNNRDELQRYLHSNGINTMIHYPIPPHLQAPYQSRFKSINSFPIAEEIAKTSLSLPIYPGLTEDSVKYICSKIISFLSL